VTPGERADLLETVLLIRSYYQDAFCDPVTTPAMLVALITASRCIDEVIDLLEDADPDLAADVAGRRPLFDIPDSIEGLVV
jgi:hypothetical protein